MSDEFRVFNDLSWKDEFDPEKTDKFWGRKDTFLCVALELNSFMYFFFHRNDAHPRRNDAHMYKTVLCALCASLIRLSVKMCVIFEFPHFFFRKKCTLFNYTILLLFRFYLKKTSYLRQLALCIWMKQKSIRRRFVKYKQIRRKQS